MTTYAEAHKKILRRAHHRKQKLLRRLRDLYQREAEGASVQREITDVVHELYIIELREGRFDG